MDREKTQAIKKKLCKELEQFADRSSMNINDLEQIHKLTDTIKNLDKIDMLEDGNSYGGTRGMYFDENSSRRGGMGSYSGSYDGGGQSRNSYRNDSYSRGSYADGGRGGNSYGGEMTEQNRQRGMLMMQQAMEDMLHNNSLNHQERETIEKALEIFRV